MLSILSRERHRRTAPYGRGSEAVTTPIGAVTKGSGQESIEPNLTSRPNQPIMMP